MITLSMIVKNEEKYIEGCLESVKNIVDEIVLVDTGSSDRTIEIAKKFNAGIYRFTWVNDFSAARNFALQKAGGDWILYLDADERLSPSSVEELKNITKTRSECAYKCLVKSIDEQNNHPSVMSYVRLFPNDRRIKFQGKVHEQVEPSLISNNYIILNSSVQIIHLGYNIKNEQLREKAERNLRLLLEEYRVKRSSYIAFQLGQTYGILGVKEKAAEYFQAAAEGNDLVPEYLSTACRYLAISAAEKNDFISARRLIDRSLSADHNQPLALMAASKIYLCLKDYDSACGFAREAFEVNKVFLTGRKMSAQNILMNEAELAFQGLEVAVSASDKNLFDFFNSAVKDLEEFRKNPQLYAEVELIEHLNANKKIDHNHFIKLQGLKEFRNPDLLLNLIRNYQYPLYKDKLLEILIESSGKNARILNEIAREYQKNKLFGEAISVYMKAISNNREEASTYFYLIACLVEAKNYTEIPGLVALAEENFRNNPSISEKIRFLKEKLTFLKNP